MQLRSEVFSRDELLSRLTTLNGTGKFVVGGVELSFEIQNSRPNQSFNTSFSAYHGWPGCLYQIGNPQQSYIAPEPLVAIGLPPYFNAKDAIAEWAGVPVSDSDGRNRKLLLFIPRFDARLEAMDFSKGVLRINTASSIPELHLSVLATDGDTTFRCTQPLQATQEFSLMPNPTQLRIFIVNEKSEILDSFTEDQNWASRERVIFAGARYPTALMDMIRHGETDAVEFKEFIRLDDRKKSADIVKAVISFANTAGGTILIGVTDDAEILGVDANTPNDSTKAATFEEDYFRSVRELLKQKLNRIPPIEMRAERVGDKTIFVIHIEEGSAKPYVNVQTKETFLRRGASDVRPDPDTELRAMLGADETSNWPGSS